MIYTARKNGHTRVFSDADGMKKLLHYRRNRWEITAELGKLEIKPHPAPRDVSSKEKLVERRGSRLHKVKAMGRWVVLDI